MELIKRHFLLRVSRDIISPIKSELDLYGLRDRVQWHIHLVALDFRLTHLSWVSIPTLTNLKSNIQIKGFLVAFFFSFLSKVNRTFFK